MDTFKSKSFVAAVGIIIVFVFVSTFLRTSYAQSDDTRRECAYYEKQSSKLNQVYHKILTEYKTDTAFVRKLKVDQKAWIMYRNAHLDALYPEGDKYSKRLFYGSVYPMCACGALAAMTVERIKTLTPRLEGTIEGNVCKGSIKVKR